MGYISQQVTLSSSLVTELTYHTKEQNLTYMKNQEAANIRSYIVGSMMQVTG